MSEDVRFIEVRTCSSCPNTPVGSFCTLINRDVSAHKKTIHPLCKLRRFKETLNGWV